MDVTWDNREGRRKLSRRFTQGKIGADEFEEGYYYAMVVEPIVDDIIETGRAIDTVVHERMEFSPAKASMADHLIPSGNGLIELVPGPDREENARHRIIEDVKNRLEEKGWNLNESES